MASMTHSATAYAPPALSGIRVAATILRRTSRGLVAMVWLSSALFGLYILTFYAAALAEGNPARWNEVLPAQHDAAHPVVATAAIGVHFAAGGGVLALGFVQLIGAIRRPLPRPSIAGFDACKWRQGCPPAQTAWLSS